MENLTIEDDSDLTEIYDTAKDCDAWFGTHSSALRKLHGDESWSYHAAIAQDHRERFWAWATGIGVFAEPLVSLDMRLAKHPKVQEMVLLLLNLIKVNLQEATESCQVSSSDDFKSLRTIRESHESPLVSGIATREKTFDSFHTNRFNQRHEPVISSETSSWELRQDIAQHAIEESLERLGYLSTTIRQSRKSSLAEKVQKYVEKHSSYYNNFKELVRKILSHLYPIMDLGLKEQLVESIVFRKARILLQQRRQQALQNERKTPSKLAATGDSTGKLAETAVNASASHSLTPKTTSQQHDVEQGPAKTEITSIRPTTLDEEAFERRLKDQPAKKKEGAQSTVSSAWAGKFRCPPPPKLPLNSNTAECPICSRLCQRNQVEDKKWWRRHIKEDIQIYTCISQDCKSPPRFFSSYAMWSYHMKTHHSTNWLSSVHPPFGWCCAMEHSEPTQFDSAEDYLEHFEECHPSQFYKLSPKDVNLVLRSGRVSLPRPVNKCPICDISADQLPSSGQAVGNRKFTGKIANDQRIYRHIADHLMVFAEISMLGVALGPDESPQASETSQKMHWDDPINSEDLQRDDLSSLSFDSNPHEPKTRSKSHDSGHLARKFRFKLQRQLRQAVQPIHNPMNAGSGRGFLTKGELYALINPESVANELTERSASKNSNAFTREIADLVCTDQTKQLPGGHIRELSYRPVFAILVLIEEPCSIERFMEEGISDLDLPLVEHEDPNFHEHGETGLYRANRKGEPQGNPLKCCEEWSSERKRLFCEYQWMLLSPFFYRSVYDYANHYNLKDQHLLPFIKHDSTLYNDTNADINDIDQEHKVHGGLEKVFSVHIHSEHHNFDGFDLDAERGFTVKQLTGDRYQGGESFKKDINTLKKLTGDGVHPHMVSVLATYEQFGKFHLIFPRANGDLFSYWKSICPSPVFDYSTVVWVAKQLAGLADGLLRFHSHRTTSKTSEDDVLFEEMSKMNQPKNISENDVPKRVEGTRFRDGQLAHVRNEQAPLNPEDSGKKSGSQSDPKPETPSRLHDDLLTKTMKRGAYENQQTLYGRHGDLNPESLLWFPDKYDDRGILKIANFDEVEFHSESNKSYQQSRGDDFSTYRPPEGDLRPCTYRQSSDIWSLGCIYLEFVTWVFGGAEGLGAFKTSRLSYDFRLRMNSDTFFESVPGRGLEHEGARLKRSVSKVNSLLMHIEDLASRTDCSEYFKDVLGLIRDMLVIESRDHDSTPNRRKNCREVHAFLKNAYEKCKDTESYAIGNCKL